MDPTLLPEQMHSLQRRGRGCQHLSMNDHFRHDGRPAASIGSHACTE
ncbi:hypothetical protein FKM82_030909 [Ascaphus truei]